MLRETCVPGDVLACFVDLPRRSLVLAFMRSAGVIFAYPGISLSKSGLLFLARMDASVTLWLLFLELRCCSLLLLSLLSLSLCAW